MKDSQTYLAAAESIADGQEKLNGYTNSTQAAFIAIAWINKDYGANERLREEFLSYFGVPFKFVGEENLTALCFLAAIAQAEGR